MCKRKNVRDTAQTESGTPVGDLPDGNGVDTLVDTGQTLTAVDVHESGHGAGCLGASLDSLVFGHLDRLHASAETHGCVGLRQTTSHATNDAGSEVVGTEAPSVVLGF